MRLIKREFFAQLSLQECVFAKVSERGRKFCLFNSWNGNELLFNFSPFIEYSFSATINANVTEFSKSIIFTVDYSLRYRVHHTTIDLAVLTYIRALSMPDLRCSSSPNLLT